MTYRELQRKLDEVMTAFVESNVADLEKLYGASVLLRNAGHGIALTSIMFGLDGGSIERVTREVNESEITLWGEEFSPKKGELS